MERIKRQIQLIRNSSERLDRWLAVVEKEGVVRPGQWWFVRREAWLHVKRSVELLAMTIMKRGFDNNGHKNYNGGVSDGDRRKQT